MNIGLALGNSVVTSISPDRIGLGGGTININGDGFATDGFSQFDPDKGNKVRNMLDKILKFQLVN